MMMMKECLRNPLTAFFMAVFILTGCRSATSPVEFYALTPFTAMTGEVKTLVSADTLSVGVGPLEIPKIIDRPQIVSRTEPNRIQVDEFHRWAGSLHEDFLRVLTLNLAELLGTNWVAAYPWEDYFSPHYRIFMEVHRFDGNLGKYVVLDLTWAITGREAADVLLVRRSLLKAPVGGMAYESYVSAKSDLLADFSREIAREIKLLNNSK